MTIPTTGDRIVCDHIERVSNEGDFQVIQNQIYRYKMMTLIRDHLYRIDDAPAQIQRLFDEIKQIDNRNDYLDRLAIDLVDPHPNHGQVAKAFETNLFAKWGKDYLRSFVLFHAVEQCGNFKDVSLQLYGGMKFNEYRTNASKIFMSIPLPQTRSRDSMYASPSSCSANSQTTSSYDNQQMSMTQFYNPSGVCFDGDSIVELKKCKKRVRELKKGDVLIDGGIVECVIETEEFGSICESVIIQGAIFTPYHPIENEGKWVFPCEIGQVVKLSRFRLIHGSILF
jgi:hypothetical protein